MFAGRAFNTTDASNPDRVAVTTRSTFAATFAYVAVAPLNVGAGRFANHRSPARAEPRTADANTASPPRENTTWVGTARGWTPEPSETKVVSTATHRPPCNIRTGCVAVSVVNDPSAFAYVADTSDR